VETSSRTDAEWDMDYDFQVSHFNANTVLFNYHVGLWTFGGGNALLEIPTQNPVSAPTPSTTPTPAPNVTFNQFRASLGYGATTKHGLSAATSFGFDAEVNQLQFLSTQATYNWDCCGMTVEYRSYTVANVRNENLFRVTFNLANIANLGNLHHQESLY
jgi:LPS-assembly protein